jgi:hypothetical protein
MATVDPRDVELWTKESAINAGVPKLSAGWTYTISVLDAPIDFVDFGAAQNIMGMTVSTVSQAWRAPQIPGPEVRQRAENPRSSQTRERLDKLIQRIKERDRDPIVSVVPDLSFLEYSNLEGDYR